VPTMTKEQRLAEIRQRIDDLEARAGHGTAEARARLQHRFDALRDDAEAASAALDDKADAVEERLADLESRVDIAAEREAAELASDATSFADAVEAELHEWDATIERMQARAAVKAYSARERAEASVAALRKERNRASERLTEVRVSTSGAWEEHRNHVRAALDDLEQKVREATAKFK
jgi:tetrahydromethanopterin S-methyltransferase subunit G